MTVQELTPVDFLSTEPLSLRAIDQAWVNKRTVELGQPNVEAALLEAVEVLHERIGPNVKEDAPVMVYTPANDTDPYVVAIPLTRRTTRELQQGHGMPPVAARPDNKNCTLREEFENLLFEEGSFDPKVLDRDSRDKYVMQWVNARWEGFQMYHNKLTLAGTASYKPKYAKTLGRFIIGKVTQTGAVNIHNVPYRHQTKALAMEEANRLSTEHKGVFAVFRCLDIVDNHQGIVLDTPFPS
jgi:hypothetical protein